MKNVTKKILRKLQLTKDKIKYIKLYKEND